MLLNRREKFFYHFAVFLGIILAVSIILGGLNLTAQRMGEIIPGLPTQIFSAQIGATALQIEFLQCQWAIPIPAFLAKILE